MSTPKQVTEQIKSLHAERRASTNELVRQMTEATEVYEEKRKAIIADLLREAQDVIKGLAAAGEVYRIEKVSSGRPPIEQELQIKLTGSRAPWLSDEAKAEIERLLPERLSIPNLTKKLLANHPTVTDAQVRKYVNKLKKQAAA
ncbi:MAG: hypothetical protein J0H49_10585 [Acidobacteria bacterium]|nr:hypothetical protein [Acidobacteriota bacterium]